MSVRMQSLPMPRRASANATGLFVWPGEGLQKEMRSKHIDMPLKERSASKTEELDKIGRIDVRRTLD